MNVGKYEWIGALMALALAGTAAPYRYDYPEQAGRSQLLEQDPERTRLTDGAEDAAVYGQWSTGEIPRFAVDWQFESPVRVRAVRFVATHAGDEVHPLTGLPLCHPTRFRLFGLDDGEAEMADWETGIPFEPGPVQEVRVVLPGGGMVTRRLRTVWELARNQVALNEVGFDVEPATADELREDCRRRDAARPPVPVLPELLPRKPDGTVPRPSRNSIFGVCGHLMHTDFFYHDPDHPQGEFTPAWRSEYTLPWVVEGRLRLVREPIYGWWFEGEGEMAGNGNSYAANRAMVESDLAAYAAAGVDVILTPFLVDARTPEGERHYRWLAGLARRYGNIVGFEMHNEPNLKGFWHGSVEEYVEAARAAAAVLKREAPEVPIIVGSFSGWGHAPDLGGETHVYAGAEGAAAWNFAERAFQLGLLDFADGVAAHPYRTASPPEGGLEVTDPLDPDGFAGEIAQWWEMVQRYNRDGRPLTLHFTEIGYSSSPVGYSGVGSTGMQANYLTRLMLVLFQVRLNGIPLTDVCWYDLKQDDRQCGDYECNFGLVDGMTAQAREAFVAYRRIAEFFDDPEDFENAGGSAAWSSEPGAVKSMLWRRRSDGALVLPFWRMERLQRHRLNFLSELRIGLPEEAVVTAVTLHDLYEDRPRSAPWRQDGAALKVSPVMVTDRAAWLEIECAE